MPTFESCAHSLRRYLFLPLCVWACNCRILFSRSSPGDDSIDGGDLTRKSGFKSLFIRKTYSGPNPDAYRGPNEDLLLWVKYFEAECCERNEIDDDFDFFSIGSITSHGMAPILICVLAAKVWPKAPIHHCGQCVRATLMVRIQNSTKGRKLAWLKAASIHPWKFRMLNVTDCPL